MAEIEDVVKVWIEQYLDLASKDFVGYVQIFENKGAMMGCSAPHPHGQIWATEEVPTEPARELASLATYKAEKDRCLLCDYLDSELRGSRTRIVCENDSFVVLVPFWAVWPFETMVLPKRHLSAVPELSEVERKDFADILKRITVRYDGLFSCSFPYSAGIHQSPTGNQANADFHMHMHFYPPLLRSSTVKKFLVGFEMLAEAQRDLTPEQTAERLRALPEIHFKDAEKTEM